MSTLQILQFSDVFWTVANFQSFYVVMLIHGLSFYDCDYIIFVFHPRSVTAKVSKQCLLDMFQPDRSPGDKNLTQAFILWSSGLYEERQEVKAFSTWSVLISVCALFVTLERLHTVGRRLLGLTWLYNSEEGTQKDSTADSTMKVQTKFKQNSTKLPSLVFDDEDLAPAQVNGTNVYVALPQTCANKNIETNNWKLRRKIWYYCFQCFTSSIEYLICYEK